MFQYIETLCKIPLRSQQKQRDVVWAMPSRYILGIMSIDRDIFIPILAACRGNQKLLS